MINIKDLLLGATMRAAHVHRYSAIPVNHKESIAEHSFFVAIYADRLAVDMCLMEQQSMILKAALWHDIEETWTGDFIRSFKYSNLEMKNQMDRGARKCAFRVFDEILRGQIHTDLAIASWDDAKRDDIVGRVVKFADFLSVISYISKEAAMGNRYAALMLKEAIPAYAMDFRTPGYGEFHRYLPAVNEIIQGGWKDVRACI